MLYKNYLVNCPTHITGLQCTFDSLCCKKKSFIAKFKKMSTIKTLNCLEPGITTCFGFVQKTIIAKKLYFVF